MEIMNFANMAVDLSFDKFMYRKLDGIPMCRHLGPTTVNMFFTSKKYLPESKDQVISLDMSMTPRECSIMRMGQR